MAPKSQRSAAGGGKQKSGGGGGAADDGMEESLQAVVRYFRPWLLLFFPLLVGRETTSGN